MNLDEIKIMWKEYGRKLQSTQAINEKIILRMIKERSTSRLSRIRREYIFSFLFILPVLLFYSSVLIWNLFGYVYSLQFVPVAIFCLCLFVSLLLIIIGYRDINVDMNQDSLDVTLKKIIHRYAKAEKTIGKVGLPLLISICILPLSSLPKFIRTAGFWPGLGEALLIVAITALLYFFAYKFGAFKDRKKYGDKFKEDLKELEELRSMSAELDGE